MKFKSRKGFLCQLLCLGVGGLLIGKVLLDLLVSKKFDLIGVYILMLLTAGLLLWGYFDTKYEITASEIIYKSGPVHGRIKIDQINEIVRNKTLWVGLKPATAIKGLIIKYGKYNEIYISPEDNDLFIDKLMEQNDTIKIISN